MGPRKTTTHRETHNGRAPLFHRCCMDAQTPFKVALGCARGSLTTQNSLHPVQPSNRPTASGIPRAGRQPLPILALTDTDPNSRSAPTHVIAIRNPLCDQLLCETHYMEVCRPAFMFIPICTVHHAHSVHSLAHSMASLHPTTTRTTQQS